ncbi:hypothetical protein SZN_26731 [Streptomyces zinciresistens K42]|uniref:Uncharacterized protein n=1 Tax=Streptomyces zinciresistens K42 TaxID=700597 RepID=G2GIK6_9ACTN|nr:hypothetical protein [Streptomyces zinciresistens]EGX56666.1 hypothetical protein SZN_26731 [Streptomyces zinciresistens K42]
MVDDNTPAPPGGNGEPGQGGQGGQDGERQGPFAVWDRSTHIGGRAALPPAPATAPGPAAQVNGSAPAAAPPTAQNGQNGTGERVPPPAAPGPGPGTNVIPRVFLEQVDTVKPPASKPSKKERRAAAEQQRAQAAAAQAPAPVPESTVTLWGGMASGKSTLLAALSKARHDPVYGKWAIWPEDHVSRKFLGDLGHILYRERRFPPSTLTEQRPVRFTLAGDLGDTALARSGRKWWRRGTPAEPQLTEFKVTVRDMPGEVFDPHSQTGAQHEEQLIKSLADSRAMVYVVDPVREWQVNSDDRAADTDVRQNADFFTDVLAGVLTETNIQGRRQGNLLPHRIAICLAKFDDDRVFRFACAQGNVRLNPRTGQPEVADAKRLFDGLCESFPHGSLREIQQQIETFFAPENVGYFVCSAIGFWVDPERGFDFENPYLVNQVEDSVRFMAAPQPINILEPFLFLRGYGPVPS